MATIALNRLSNRVVEIIRDGSPEYFTGVANVFLKNRTTRDGAPYIDVVFKTVVGDNKTIQLMYNDITTINGVAKPAAVLDGVKLIATDVFSIGGGDVQGVTQAAVDSSIASALTAALDVYKKESELIFGSIFLDFTTTTAGTSGTAITGTIAGASSGDIVAIGNSSNLPSSCMLKCVITGSGSNNAVFRMFNIGTADLDPVAGTYKYVVMKPNT